MTILLVSIIVIAGCTSSTRQESNQATPQQALFTSDTKDLLPTRSEINTEWKIGGTEPIKIEEIYQKQGLEGFENGTVMELDILEGTSLTVGYIRILRFDGVNNAELFYSSLINNIKNEGGYKEKDTSGINANCFAIESGNTLEGYYRDVYCKKNNIFFNTEISTFRVSRLSEYKDWANFIANKLP